MDANRTSPLPARVLVEDPSAYRPSTPILNWQGPRRSVHGPRLYLWIALTLLCTIQMVVAAVVPGYIDGSRRRSIFIGVWIGGNALLTGFVAFMSTSRHLLTIAALLRVINSPTDLDSVVERLEDGRFSRLAEPWQLQVELIKLFCRLLKYHHGVNPETGTRIDIDLVMRQRIWYDGEVVAAQRRKCRTATRLAHKQQQSVSSSAITATNVTAAPAPAAAHLALVPVAATPTKMTPLTTTTIHHHGAFVAVPPGQYGHQHDLVDLADLGPLVDVLPTANGGFDTSLHAVGDEFLYSLSLPGTDGEQPADAGTHPRITLRHVVPVAAAAAAHGSSAERRGTPTTPVPAPGSGGVAASHFAAVAAAALPADQSPPLTTAPGRTTTALVAVGSASSSSGGGGNNNSSGGGGLLLLAATSSFRRARTALTCADPHGDNARTWPEMMTIAAESGGTGGAAAASGSRSLFLQLLSQVKVGQDLSKIQLPVTILEPRSLLEKLSDMFVFPRQFAAIADSALTPQQRVVAIARWYFSGFRMRPPGAKKPYNPVLGETFECTLGHGGDEVHYLAEQVSHHPPTSVFRALHVATGLEIVASFQPRSKLVSPNTAGSLPDGLIVLRVPLLPPTAAAAAAATVASSSESPSSGGAFATYHLTWPSAFVSGIMTSPMRLEVAGDVAVTPVAVTPVAVGRHAATPPTAAAAAAAAAASVPVAVDAGDFSAEIKFHRKGWFGGSGGYDRVSGAIMRNTAAANQQQQRTHVFDGVWHERVTIAPAPVGTGAAAAAAAEALRAPFVDADVVGAPVRPVAVDTVFPRPSRVVWEKLTAALRQRGDAYSAAAAQAEKHAVELVQREQRRALEARGEEYLPGYFRLVSSSDSHEWQYIGPRLGSL